MSTGARLGIGQRADTKRDGRVVLFRVGMVFHEQSPPTNFPNLTEKLIPSVFLYLHSFYS
jgi:hypothetical protein